MRDDGLCDVGASDETQITANKGPAFGTVVVHILQHLFAVGSKVSSEASPHCSSVLYAAHLFLFSLFVFRYCCLVSPYHRRRQSLQHWPGAFGALVAKWFSWRAGVDLPTSNISLVQPGRGFS